MKDEVIETMAEWIGTEFATLVSGNRQPMMSGDPRDSLQPHIRRAFDAACQSSALSAIRALEASGFKIVGREATEGMVHAIDYAILTGAIDDDQRIWAAAFDAAPSYGEMGE